MASNSVLQNEAGQQGSTLFSLLRPGCERILQHLREKRDVVIEEETSEKGGSIKVEYLTAFDGPIRRLGEARRSKYPGQRP